MPKVVRFHELGGPEVLKIEEAPTPQPGKGEVRLKVQAVGLNRAESMFFHGRYLDQPKFPSLLGYEAAGVVEAVGPAVDSDWLGKRAAVIPSFSMNRYGLLGEEALVPASALGEYPEKLSAVEGAAVWMQYLTAYGALIELGRIGKGDFVVITAASSSVGLAAIQMVRAEGGVSIAATRRSTKKAELTELGADHVVATEEEDLAIRVKEITGGNGARVIFDPVAGPFVEKLAESAAHGGMILEYGALSPAPTPLPLFTMLHKALTIRAFTLFEVTGFPAKLKDAKQYVYERLEDGRFRPKVAKTFPFSQTVDAYKYLESNAQVGKVVITVG